ncbi:MAG: carbohydrate binding family 9 domain-containing protein [candidate division KSB1 bacterium]|nr:carbohydrate binding family 9 domain-containing protein [candidate division KSB1 bacterium]
MKHWITIVLIAIIFSTTYANNQDKIMVLRQTSTPIQVDGRIDAAWSLADSVSDFVQHQPYHGVAPSRATVAKLLASERALYCLIICYDDRASIQNHKGMLDEMGGDVVSLMLDTFGNKRTAYKFAVTASGVRADCRLLDDARNRDYSWDGIWFSAAQIYDWGYVVEMEIPFKSIQYDEKLNEWGLDIDRWIPTRTEDIYWCRYEENEGQRVSKFGRLVFENFQPTAKGLNLEIYPVGITKFSYLRDRKYEATLSAGIDIFYNPSPKLTYQLTVNPDFAQIEADPYQFNISRYESYFSERRPFFTEGNEIFMASGRERQSGFYRPLELFYSRRIGKKLPDGSEVPLLFGTKAFGRANSWEYGGFVAMTGDVDYEMNDQRYNEPRAYFGSIRLKKQILGNSSLGILAVAKHSHDQDNGVLDIDGALRMSDWQLSYQLAQSFKNGTGDVAGSAGFSLFREKYMVLARGRYIGKDFDVEQVGFVPWKGTGQFVGLGGPRWYFKEGAIRQIMVYTGGMVNYERVDAFTDYGGLIGYNMQFRSNWGFELNFDFADSKDAGVRYTTKELNFSSWFHTHPKWHGNIWGGYYRTYNFAREYLAYYWQVSGELEWQALNSLELGTSANVFVEGKPNGQVQDVFLNARPYFSITPVNNLSLRAYLDDLFVRSTDRTVQTIFGLLFSYNFSPKSWIYFAVNETRSREPQFDALGHLIANRLRVQDRDGVFKLKYLYYF